MSDSASDRPDRPARSAGLLCRDVASAPFRPIPLVRDRLRIGRRFENDVVLSHASVSRFHAEVVYEGGRWMVMDCDSKFGTSVNGERVVRAALAPGDEIRIGGADGPLLIFSPVGVFDGDAMPAGGEDGPPGWSERAVADGSLHVPEPTQVRHDSNEQPGTPSGDALRLVEQFRATSLIGGYREALTLVADAALELTHFHRAILVLVDRSDPTDGALRTEVVRSRWPVAPAPETGREEVCARRAIETGKIVAFGPGIEIDGDDRDFAARAAAGGVERMVCVPLRAHAGGAHARSGVAERITVGALYLEAGRGVPPVDGVVTVLESLASEAGLVAERLYARQMNIARIREHLDVRSARARERSEDPSLPVADRARAGCELVTCLVTLGDLDGATAVLDVFDDPEARLQLPPGIRADLLKCGALVLMWQENWHRAAGLMNAALDNSIEAQNVVLEMSIRTYLARCYWEIGEFGMARENALTSVSVLRRADESSIDCARALLMLGILEQMEGDAISASHALKAALRIAEQTDDLVTRASAHYRLGLIHAGRGDTASAIASFQSMLEVAHPTGNAQLELRGQEALAAALVRSGAWRRAEAVISNSVKVASEPRFERTRARLLLLAAQIAVYRDGDNAAEQAIVEVRAVAPESGHDWVTSEADLLEAELRLERGDLDAAKRLVEAAEGIARELRDDGQRARAHLLQAEVERRNGRPDAADAQVELAQRAIAGRGDLGLAGLVQQAAGRLNADRGRLTEAQHHFAQSLSIFRTLDDRRLIASVHHDLGNLMLAADDPACARTHLESSRTIYSELGAATALAAVNGSLAAAVSRSGSELPASYSSAVLASRSEPRFVRRLLEASQSRDLLLRELSSVAIDVARATHATVAAIRPDGYIEMVAVTGESNRPVPPMLELLLAARGEIVRAPERTLYPVEPPDAAGRNEIVTVLAVNVGIAEGSRHDLALQTVVQLARQGLELLALRASLKRADLPDPGVGVETGDPLGVQGLIYASASMRKIGDQVQRIRTSTATVLITGASGVGKELVASAIHAASPRSAMPFVPFNCSAAPRELVESQLFGHRRGAFTGAATDLPGVARAARGGTLFLDEVGDLPLDIQPKLLRFLEQGEIQPLGESAPLRVDVRVIAATNMDLERAVADRRFREDLFHRLNIIRLHVPPLRERREDIPLLVSHFLVDAASRTGLASTPSISEAALDALLRFPWPGNVRQLRNEIERAVTFCGPETTITLDMLSQDIADAATTEARWPAAPDSREGETLADRLRRFEVEEITRALATSSLNLTHAAAALGMARQNLQRRLKKLGIRVPDAGRP